MKLKIAFLGISLFKSMRIRSRRKNAGVVVGEGVNRWMTGSEGGLTPHQQSCSQHRGELIDYFLSAETVSWKTTQVFLLRPKMT